MEPIWSKDAELLGEHSHGRLQSGNRPKQVLLFRIELCEFLLGNLSGLVQGLLVLRNFLLQVLDLSVETSTASCEVLNGSGELLNLGFRIRDGLGLLLVVGLAPASELVIDLLILLSLLFKLLQHVLQKGDDLGHWPVLGCFNVKSERRTQLRLQRREWNPKPCGPRPAQRKR